MAYIDKIFRKHGEDFFGKEVMDQITDEQVEEARCEAFKGLTELTAKYGRQEKGTVEELFCNYIFSEFI